MPLVWLLHAERSTAFGHVIFGALMARFPAYLPKAEPAKGEPANREPNAAAPDAAQPTEAIPPNPDPS